MKLLPRSIFALAAAAALLAAPVGQVFAQNVKPVLVVSVSSIEDTLADIGYITRVAGAEAVGRTAIFSGQVYTNGLDRKKPIGMYVAPKGGGDFVPVVFLPVTNFKDFLGTLGALKDQIGEVKDAGDNVKEITGPNGQSVYFKEQTGWAFASNAKENLTDLPADPSTLLGALPKEYTLAVKVNMANIPENLKKVAVDAIKDGFERQLQNNPAGNDFTEKVQRGQLDSFLKTIDELDQVMFGFAIDGPGKRTYLDVNITAREGTNLAKQYAMLADTKSSFSGFLIPGAAATLNLSQTMLKEDIEQSVAMLKTLRTQFMKQIDDDPNLDAGKRGAAKEVVGSLLDAFTKTVEGGKIDGGAVLMLDAKTLDFAAGGTVGNGKEIEDSFKRLIDLAKNEPDFPTVKLNFGSHGGIAFHSITAPIPDSEREAREILGDKVNIVLGIGPKAVYVAFGKNAESLLKQVIDKSAQDGSKSVPPMQLNVAVLPILKFAASVDANNPVVPELIKVLEKSGKDKVNIIAQPIKNGGNTRIQVEEGVLQIIGTAAAQSGLIPPPGM